MVDINREDSGRDYIDPRLLALMDEAEKKDGINIKDLKKGDVVEIVTKNHIYKLLVLNPAEIEVQAASNGPSLTEPMVTGFVGSSLTGTGTMVSVGWIMPGYRVCLGDLVLSATQEIRVNGKKVLPK